MSGEPVPRLGYVTVDMGYGPILLTAEQWENSWCEWQEIEGISVTFYRTRLPDRESIER